MRLGINATKQGLIWKQPQQNKMSKENSKSGEEKIMGLAAMKGNMYVYGTGDQQERFIRTTEVLEEYVGKEYGRKAWTLVAKREEAHFEEPADPGRQATRGQFEKF